MDNNFDYNNSGGYNLNGQSSQYYMSEEEKKRRRSSAVTGTFGIMFLGLVVTLLGCSFALSTFFYVNFLYTFGNIGYYGLIIAELALVLILSSRLHKMKTATAFIMFFAYAFLNGVTLSLIFWVYNVGIIAIAFLSAAGMFAVMAIYGAVTKSDLTSIGNIFVMGLFGLIVATVINFFFKSDVFDTIVCYAGVAIFLGLTAYDTQKIKKLVEQSPNGESTTKIMIIGALNLYLDMINIFLYILRILNRKK